MTIYYKGAGYYMLDQCWDIHARTGGEFILRQQGIDAFLPQHPDEIIHPAEVEKELPHDLHGVVVDTIAIPYKDNPRVKNVFCYHGPGWGHLLGPCTRGPLKNRPYWEHISYFDYYLVSGPRDVQKYRWHFNLTAREAETRCIPVGLLRSDEILSGKYDRNETRKKLGIADTKRPVVLFAPTGSFAKGSLVTHGPTICESLNATCTLLVRGHPGNPEPIDALKHYVDKCNLENVHFVDGLKMGLIENMSAADLLISDQSTIILDWLYFDKPIIFTDNPLAHHIDGLEWSTGKKFDVQRCGYHYTAGEPNLAELVHKSLTANPFAQAIIDYRENCFYFNDGRAAERAADFITCLHEEFKPYDHRKMDPRFEKFPKAETINVLFDIKSRQEWEKLEPIHAVISEQLGYARCKLMLHNQNNENDEWSNGIRDIRIEVVSSAKDLNPDVVFSIDAPHSDYGNNTVVGTIMTNTLPCPYPAEGSRLADFIFIYNNTSLDTFSDDEASRLIQIGRNDTPNTHDKYQRISKTCLVEPGPNVTSDCLTAVLEELPSMGDFQFTFHLPKTLGATQRVLCQRMAKVIPNLEILDAINARHEYGTADVLITDSADAATQFATYGGKIVFYEGQPHGSTPQKASQLESLPNNMGLVATNAQTLNMAICNLMKTDVVAGQCNEQDRDGDNLSLQAALKVVDTCMYLARPHGWRPNGIGMLICD